MTMKEESVLSIKEVSNKTDLQQAQKIRIKVLEEEQGFPHNLNIDSLDEAASLHALIFDGENPVATARLTFNSARSGKIERIAILKSHRGQGLGRELIEFLEVKARSLGLTQLLVEPHVHLENFFKRLGYQRIFGITEVAGIPLIKMEKQLISNYKVNNEES